MTYRRVRVLLAAGSLLVAGSAFAADLPSRTPAPVFVPPAPIFTWTGFYVGAYAGGSFDGRATSTFPTGFAASTNRNGFTGGGLVGYDKQFGSLVLSAEGEAGYSGARGSGRFPTGADMFREQSDGFIGRVRGRVGYAVGNFGFGDAMLYVAGGGSFTSDRQTFAGPDFGGLQTARKDRAGFNVGGGAELAITSHIIGRVEYLYDDYGRARVGLPDGTGSNSKITDNTVRAALEYKF